MVKESGFCNLVRVERGELGINGRRIVGGLEGIMNGLGRSRER